MGIEQQCNQQGTAQPTICAHTHACGVRAHTHTCMETKHFRLQRPQYRPIIYLINQIAHISSTTIDLGPQSPTEISLPPPHNKVMLSWPTVSECLTVSYTAHAHICIHTCTHSNAVMTHCNAQQCHTQHMHMHTHTQPSESVITKYRCQSQYYIPQINKWPQHCIWLKSHGPMG